MFIGCNLNDLNRKGLKVGKNFELQLDCFIDYSHSWLISIGDNVIFALRVHIIARDATTRIHSNMTRIGKIKIGNNVIVLPNVEIGDGSIVGAGSVVTKSIPLGCVYAGNPAKFIFTIEKYKEKTMKKFENSATFDESYAIENDVSEEKKKEMVDKLDSIDKCGFMV